ncbi:50S ribosomal protein L25 [Jeotgalibaca porci]|uniref:Large ribosomal subunit protein bL25 n=1 Tax=Jeotgalibaca porci TaxID=1868793 RepID=A0A6G7WJ66_9LACT|nr:50S ribosomal protein L25 [Jeotgalibaca porci]NLB98032.1 50S ribosomal protein L25 [Lactobacillales bacterium]QIK52282.1 50S ribosomal protein L25 [Jeotgalibaca porci]
MKLKAQKRERLGTSASKQARNDNKVPATIFGSDMEAQSVLIDRKEFDELLRELGRNAVFNIDLDGEETQVLIKNIDLSALKPEIYNVELNALTKGQKVTVPVTIVLEGLEDVKEGVVTQTLNEVEVETDPLDIPTEITLNVSDLVIGDTVVVSDLKVPENVTVLAEAEETVVVVAAPRVEEEPTDGDAEVAEPEVIGEKEE